MSLITSECFFIGFHGSNDDKIKYESVPTDARLKELILEHILELKKRNQKLCNLQIIMIGLPLLMVGTNFSEFNMDNLSYTYKKHNNLLLK